MTLENVIEDISSELIAGSELISDDKQNEKILEFKMCAEQIRSELKLVEESGRVMRLGIVGEVKAGKTSFLNSFLFGGQTVLPKAATPMTAALTRIRYNSKPSAKVVFFEKSDWDGLVVNYALNYEKKIDSEYKKYLKDFEEKNKLTNAKNTGEFINKLVQNIRSEPKTPMNREQFVKCSCRGVLSSEERSCHEIYQMAKERMNDYELRECLGTEKVIQLNSGKDLIEELNNYVGAKGKFTPIVKYTIIELDIPELNGVEIIDTPGMNDPIISRSRITRNFLKECDALFLLSYCGQFLGRDDMQVISKVLPEDGVARCILVGTKIDSAILQYNKRNVSFDEAYKGTKRNCYKQADENIRNITNSQIRQMLCDPDNPEKIQKPYLTSAMAYSTSKKIFKNQELDKEEQLMIENLSKRFEDFKTDQETLCKFSQIERIKDIVFPTIRADKDHIIEESKKKTRLGQQNKFLRILEDIANETRQIQKDLRDSDIDMLREKLRVAKEGLDNARIAVSGIFESASVKMKKTIIPDLQVDVHTEVENHLHINVTSTTKTEHHVESSGILWWKTTESWDEHITTYTAEVSDVEHNIRAFYTQILRLTNDAMKEAVKLEQLKKDVIDKVGKAFDITDRYYDESSILIPINNALELITIPHIDIDLEKYLALLEQNLTDDQYGTIYENGVVKNDAIPLLKRAQEHVMTRLTKDVCEEIKQQGQSIAQELEKQAGVFIDRITQKLIGNHRKVESMINDKEVNLEKLGHFIDFLSMAKTKIQEAK